MSRSRGRVYPVVKRAVDVAISGVGLVLGAPVMGAVAVAVRKDLGSPVLFRQVRPGKDGKPFWLVKFRTMRPTQAANGIGDDEQRLTALGRFLRSTSLDELPTLWNVMRGHMSLVGPRPLLMEYLERYTPEQARRHEVRPGVTGLAQVRGRNALNWEQKFAADIEYVDGMTFGRDIRILVATIGSVLRRQGISAPDGKTMTLFLGTDTPEPAMRTDVRCAGTDRRTHS